MSLLDPALTQRVQPPEELGQSLAAALRYVSEWKRKRVVVKFGGRAMAEGDYGTLIEDVVSLQQAGLRPILVHGGGPEISEQLERNGIEPRFVDGLRVTDEATMRVVEMVLGGTVNKRLVGFIQERGGHAVGLTGKDGGLLRVRPHDRSSELGYVGEVQRVDTTLLDSLLDGGFVPVIGSLGVDSAGATYNLNADTAAAELAAAIGAEKLLLLTDVPGVLVPKEDGEEGETEVLAKLVYNQVESLIERGIVSAGMVPKVRACQLALREGVTSAHIVSAGQPHSLLVELFTDGGVGTMMLRDLPSSSS